MQIDRSTNASHDDAVAAAQSALEAALPKRRTLPEERSRAARANLEWVTPNHAEYPTLFHRLASPPPYFYRWGAPLTDRPTVAIVGSRRATARGETFAQRVASELSEAGFRIVSGLARGIDRAALEGALRAAGRPVAILGNGLPRIYPTENRSLAGRIAASGGAILSELPCDAPPRRQHFPKRNRLISGLSVGVLIVEATERSGTLITAAWALEQGRELLAVPGPIDAATSAGCHRLIREGATLVTSTEEILEGCAAAAPPPPVIPPALQQAVEAGERDLERLLEVSGLPPARFLEAWRALQKTEPPPFSGGKSPDPTHREQCRRLRWEAPRPTSGEESGKESGTDVGR